MTKIFYPLRGNPEDSFAKQMLVDLEQLYTADIIYLDSIDTHKLINLTYEYNTVFIMARDQIEYSTINNVEQLADRYPNKQIIILCEHEGILSTRDNLYFINIGGKILDDYDYRLISVPIKNFSSSKLGISLNRQMRPHRIALLSLLYGLGLDEYVHISAMHLYKQLQKINSDNLLDHLSWGFAPRHDDIRSVMISGFKKTVAIKDQFIASTDIYVMQGEICVYLNNVDNFNQRLNGLYTNSFVEIISESWFTEPYPFLTEKYLNSVYGQNFPIFIASKNYVKYIKKLGFDVFDDIIDHSYDLIDDPLDRLSCAVLKNQHLLKDSEKTKEVWKKCQCRFDKNVDFARKNMYSKFKENVFRSIVEKI